MPQVSMYAAGKNVLTHPITSPKVGAEVFLMSNVATAQSSVPSTLICERQHGPRRRPARGSLITQQQ